MHVGCGDHLDLVLRITAAWEWSDTDRRPWEASEKRRAWAAKWWVSHDALLAAAAARREVLEALSPAMKEEAKRFVDPRLRSRSRAVLSRAFGGFIYRRQLDDTYRIDSDDDLPAAIDRNVKLDGTPDQLIAFQRRVDRAGDRVYLRNLVEVVPWAIDDQPTPLELLLRCAAHRPSSEEAGPDDPLLPLLSRIPIGAHARVSVRTNSAGEHVIAHFHESVEPLEVPATTADGSDVTTDEPGNDAVAVTAVVETDAPDAALLESSDERFRWPTGTEPQEDEEALERAAVLDPADDPLDQEKGLETNDDDTTDGLVAIRPPTDALADVSALGQYSDITSILEPDRPLDGKSEDIWAFCRSYSVSESGQIRVHFSAPTSPEAASDSGFHRDLAVGAEIAVTVGPMVSDDTTKYRSLLRADDAGRFLLTEARPPRRRSEHELPVSLDDNYVGLLGGLIEGTLLRGTIIPGPCGTKSITLRPMLSAHLTKASTESIIPPGSTTGRRAPFWPAVVTEPPNQNGYARIELLHQDTATGIRHAFGVSQKTRETAELELVSDQPLLVQLGHGPHPVLRGPTELLTELASRFPQALVLDGTSAGEETGAVALRARRPVPGAALQALLATNDDAAWYWRVWDFYVLSHNRLVTSIQPGTVTTAQDVSADSEARKAAYREFATDDVVVGRVARVTDAGVIVAFRGGAEGFTNTDNLPADGNVAIGEAIIARVYQVDPDRERLILNLKSPYQLTVTAPDYWRDALRSQRDAIEEITGGMLHMRTSVTIQLGHTSQDGAETAYYRLLALFGSPAAEMAVPERRKRDVIGQQGNEIRRLQAMPGVWTCQFLDNDLRLTVIADDPAQLKDVLGAVERQVSTFAGRMQVPYIGASGALIGTGGQTVRTLRKQSECFYADAIRGTCDWNLRARTPEAIEKFIELANQKVPGCTGGVVSVDGPPVKDLLTGQAVADWRSHEFTFTDTVRDYAEPNFPLPKVLLP